MGNRMGEHMASYVLQTSDLKILGSFKIWNIIPVLPPGSHGILWAGHRSEGEHIDFPFFDGCQENIGVPDFVDGLKGVKLPKLLIQFQGPI